MFKEKDDNVNILNCSIKELYRYYIFIKMREETKKYTYLVKTGK